MINVIPDYTASALGESMNMIEYNLDEVDQDVSIFSGSEDGVLGVEPFLLEPECKILVDDGLNFDTFDPQNCFNSFSFAADYDQIKIDSDALDSYLTYEGEETKLEFLDGFLQGVEEVFEENKSFLGKHEDCLSDDPTESEEVLKLDNGLCKKPRLESVAFGSCSPGVNERECVAEKSNLSSASASTLETTFDQSYPLDDQMTVQELREAFGSMFGCETLVTDKQWLKHRILFGLQNHAELNNGMNFLDCRATSPENADSAIFSSSVESPRSASCSFVSVSDNTNVPGDERVKRKLASCNSMNMSSSEVSRALNGSPDRGDIGDTGAAQKRLRKPTRRYIEESLEHNSRCNNRKCGISYKSSRDKVLYVKSQKQHCEKGSGVAQLVHKEEILNVACIQVPFGLPIEEAHFKKQMLSLDHDTEDCKDNELSVSNENYEIEPFLAESQDDNSQCDYVKRSNLLKGVKQRKHHKSWTPSEVMKLIEGVSMYGVGRWTEIKRLLFPASTHRSSVDLKDKWRNLLKASCAQLQSNREVEQGRRQATHQVPRYILRRVRELAAVYPYPREVKSKISCTTPVASPFPATSNNMLMPLSTGVGG